MEDQKQESDQQQPQQQFGVSEVLPINQQQNQQQSQQQNQYGTSSVFGKSIVINQQEEVPKQNSNFGSSEVIDSQSTQNQSNFGSSSVIENQNQQQNFGSSEVFQPQQQQQQQNTVFQQQQLQQKQIQKSQQQTNQEYEQMIKKFEDLSLILPFNPFDFQNVNNLKLFIMSINDQYSKREKTVLMEGAYIGRNNDCFVWLEDSRISRQHAQIFFINNNFWIRDTKSNAGTFFKIKKNILEPNMIIQLGITIEFRVLSINIMDKQAEVKIVFEKPNNLGENNITIQEGQPFIFGREKETTSFHIEDNTISQKQTQIIMQNQQLFIEDLQSKNGTWLRLSLKGIESNPYLLTEDSEILLSNVIKLTVVKINILQN